MKAAGVRNQRITIQTPAIVKGSIGDVTRTWSTHATAWASIETAGGNEFDRARQVHAELTHLIHCRWISGVTTDMRVLYKGRAMNILRAVDRHGRKDELVLMCNEQLD